MNGVKCPGTEQLDFDFMAGVPSTAPSSVEAEMLSIFEFCQVSGVKRSTAYLLLNKGLLVRAKIGRRSLIPRKSVDEFLSKAASDGIRY